MLDHSCQVQRHSLAERGADLYETPAVAIEALLRVEKIPHHIWEPAAGRGAIVKVLREHGHAVIASDLIDYGFPLHFVGDFLTQTKAPTGTEAILTNPPFMHAAEFVAKALELCPRVFMLMRLAFFEAGELNHKRRDRHLRALVLDGGKLARIHAFRLRLPMMHRDGWDGKKSNSGVAFGWFCWDTNHNGKTVIDRIDWREPAAGEPGQSPTIITEATMAPRKTETTLALEEPTLDLEKPIVVGNPAAADSLAIDQSHMEEFTTSEEKSAGVRFGRPPKGIYVTALAETAKPWKNRAFYFLCEIEGRDPYIIAPKIAKLKADEDVIRPILIVRYVTMAGEEGLWPFKLDKPDAKSSRWNTSALRALEEAEKGWLRLISAKGHYHFTVSKKTLEQTPPKFSNRSFQELIDIEFRDRKVLGLDHEIWDVLDSGSDK